MGCFNESCMVTGLPILYGEPCSIVLLLESPYHNSSCYASNAWAPLFIMDGTYDDYGSIEKKETEEYKKLTELLFQHLPVSYDKSRDNQFDSLVYETGLGRVSVDCDSGITADGKQELQLRPVLLNGNIRKLAEDNMLEHPDENETLENMLSAIEKNLPEGDPHSEEYLCAEFRLIDQIGELMRDLSSSAPNPVLRGFITDIVRTDAATAIPMIRSLLQLNILLEDLRKAWHIPSGSGSQESVTPAHRALGKLYMSELDRLETYDGDF